MSFLPPTGDPPFTFHFQEVTQRGEKLMVRGRKCRKKKKKENLATKKNESNKKEQNNTNSQALQCDGHMEHFAALGHFGAYSKHTLVKRDNLG